MKALYHYPHQHRFLYLLSRFLNTLYFPPDCTHSCSQLSTILIPLLYNVLSASVSSVFFSVIPFCCLPRCLFQFCVVGDIVLHITKVWLKRQRQQRVNTVDFVIDNITRVFTTRVLVSSHCQYRCGIEQAPSDATYRYMYHHQRRMIIIVVGILQCRDLVRTVWGLMSGAPTVPIIKLNTLTTAKLQKLIDRHFFFFLLLSVSLLLCFAITMMMIIIIFTICIRFDRSAVIVVIVLAPTVSCIAVKQCSFVSPDCVIVVSNIVAFKSRLFSVVTG